MNHAADGELGGEDAAFAIDQHGADRHVAARGCRLGFDEGQLHW